MTPSLEEAKKYQADYRILPVIRAIKAGTHEPVEMLRTLRGLTNQVYLLENTHETENGAEWNRYTYIGFEPSMELYELDGKLTVVTGASKCTYTCENPVQVLGGLLKDSTAPKIEGLPPFTGGLAGYFSYEYIQCIEKDIKWSCENEEHFKDFDLMFLDKLYIYDRQEKEILLVANIRTDCLEENYARAEQALEAMERILEGNTAGNVKPLTIEDDFKLMFTKERHMENVEKAKEYITNGDVAQIVLSNSQEAKASGSLVDAYAVLRENDPTHFMCYFSSDDLEAAMASPETILNVSDGKIFAERLAGTFARGKTKEEDLALEKELLSDPKSIDEHNMLVDDTRNELGPVSQFGSIKVEDYMRIVRCSCVMHIGSVITGKLRDDMTALDAIGYISPSGVVSGAPKITSCEVISKIEKNRRGIYGAAVGYIGFNGDSSFFAFIHSAYLKNGKVCVRSGGGIVIDSVPEDEFNECLFKASAMVASLRRAEGGRKNGSAD